MNIDLIRNKIHVLLPFPTRQEKTLLFQTQCFSVQLLRTNNSITKEINSLFYGENRSFQLLFSARIRH